MNLSSVFAFGVFISLAVSSLAHDNNAGRVEDNSAENKGTGTLSSDTFCCVNELLA